MLNFKISELIHSDTANRYNINNMPDIAHLDNMLNLIYYVLQPLRDKLGCPVIVTSGYRSGELNRTIGGARNSQHLTGQAADIQVPQKDLKQVFNLIKTTLPYDQLLYEYDSNGNNWIHVSYNHDKNRKQAIDNYKAY